MYLEINSSELSFLRRLAASNCMRTIWSGPAGLMTDTILLRFDMGVAFRIKYGELLKGFTDLPVFRTTSEERMVESA